MSFGIRYAAPSIACGQSSGLMMIHRLPTAYPHPNDGNSGRRSIPDCAKTAQSGSPALGAPVTHVG